MKHFHHLFPCTRDGIWLHLHNGICSAFSDQRQANGSETKKINIVFPNANVYIFDDLKKGCAAEKDPVGVKGTKWAPFLKHYFTARINSKAQNVFIGGFIERHSATASFVTYNKKNNHEEYNIRISIILMCFLPINRKSALSSVTEMRVEVLHGILKKI